MNCWMKEECTLEIDIQGAMLKSDLVRRIYLYSHRLTELSERLNNR